MYILKDTMFVVTKSIKAKHDIYQAALSQHLKLESKAAAYLWSAAVYCGQRLYFL